MKTTEEQVKEAVQKEREKIRRMLRRLLCKNNAAACTMRHVGYNLGIEDALERIR